MTYGGSREINSEVGKFVQKLYPKTEDAELMAVTLYQILTENFSKFFHQFTRR